MSERTPLPPAAKIVPFEYTVHQHQLSDPYAWLQNKDDPEVLAFLEAENAYAAAVLKPIEALQESIFHEMVGRIQEDDADVPEQRGDYYYYWRIQKGQQYKVYCRKHQSLDAPEQVLLDENILAEGKPYCRVHVFEPSPDQTLLAYSVDTTGALVFDLYVLDMRSGEILAGPIANTAWTAAWASDNRTLYYTIFDDSHRAFKLFKHQVKITADSAAKSDDLIYHELDDSFFLILKRTRSGAFLTLTSFSATTTEVRYLPADQPEQEFKLIQPRQHWMEYYVEHHGGRFLIRTNDQAENFKLMEAPLSDPSKENWREVLPHRADVLVEDVDAFASHLVVYERQGGLQRIRISSPDVVSHVHFVEFPDPVYTFSTRANPEFETRLLRFEYSSLVTPRSIIDLEMDQHRWDVRKVQQIPSGYDASRYTSERLFATAPDGAQVPVSIVYQKGLVKDGSHPLLLEGYGSYGYSFDPAFDARRLSLLERGFVFAIAHIRGGSEMGRAWYENGRLMHKKNTFTDFIASAEQLIEQGYTSSDRLGIHGASAGGLLVSAVLNLRPDLFKAAIARVPFTNVITAMLDPDLPLTVIEWEQWGNPKDPQAFDYMLSYSPYENIEAKSYPHILVKTGLNDLQVPYWDPAKWVARLRSCKTDQNQLLLVTNMGAGHGGASGRYDHLKEDAQMYAFLIEHCGRPGD
jgi:oligopeptidase B